MQNQLGAEYPASERQRFLSDNCDRVEELSYRKAFGPDEQSQYKDELSEVSIDIDNAEEEKKEINAEINDRLKSLKKKKGKILEALRNKGQQVQERCYMFVDHDTKQVGYYNADGQLVNLRAMRPDEMQKTVFNVNRTIERTGTDD